MLHERPSSVFEVPSCSLHGRGSGVHVSSEGGYGGYEGLGLRVLGFRSRFILLRLGFSE